MNIRDWLRIEKRRYTSFDRERTVRFAYWVVDKREANVAETGPFLSFAEAQDEWSRIAATAAVLSD